MIRAYGKLYLEKARNSLARMLDYMVNDMKLSLDDAFNQFAYSEIAKRFEHGDVSIIAGRSGVELAYEIMPSGTKFAKPTYDPNRSVEYWVGWALAYYQWQTCLSFAKIISRISIEEIASLYSPYHEMDIRQFCDKMNELYTSRQKMSNLKSLRERFGLSQSELAEKTGIPVRTIQQYEQGQKNINKSNAEYVISLSRVLCCEPIDLLEITQID